MFRAPSTPATSAAAATGAATSAQYAGYALHRPHPSGGSMAPQPPRHPYYYQGAPLMSVAQSQPNSWVAGRPLVASRNSANDDFYRGTRLRSSGSSSSTQSSSTLPPAANRTNTSAQLASSSSSSSPKAPAAIGAPQALTTSPTDFQEFPSEVNPPVSSKVSVATSIASEVASAAPMPIATPSHPLQQLRGGNAPLLPPGVASPVGDAAIPVNVSSILQMCGFNDKE